MLDWRAGHFALRVRVGERMARNAIAGLQTVPYSDPRSANLDPGQGIGRQPMSKCATQSAAPLDRSVPARRPSGHSVSPHVSGGSTTLCRRTTSDMFAPSSKLSVSSTIVSASENVSNGRCRTSAFFGPLRLATGLTVHDKRYNYCLSLSFSAVGLSWRPFCWDALRLGSLATRGVSRWPARFWNSPRDSDDARLHRPIIPETERERTGKAPRARGDSIIIKRTPAGREPTR